MSWKKGGGTRLGWPKETRLGMIILISGKLRPLEKAVLSTEKTRRVKGEKGPEGDHHHV